MRELGCGRITKEDAVAKLEAVYDRLLIGENKHWPDKEDLAGGSVWRARQDVADLLHSIRNERTK